MYYLMKIFGSEWEEWMWRYLDGEIVPIDGKLGIRRLEPNSMELLQGSDVIMTFSSLDGIEITHCTAGHCTAFFQEDYGECLNGCKDCPL